MTLCCCRWASLGSSQDAAFPSRLPGAFQTFSSLRETFPEVSGYCYCADSLGRELADTGKYPPAAHPLTWGALNSQGKGQVTSISLQICLGLQFHSYKGWDHCDQCSAQRLELTNEIPPLGAELQSVASGAAVRELILSFLGWWNRFSECPTSAHTRKLCRIREVQLANAGEYKGPGDWTVFFLLR